MNNIKRIFLWLIGIIAFSNLYSQQPEWEKYWNQGTAYTQPKHRCELSLFNFSSYGLSDNLEISAHPLMFFLMPQVQVKAGWGEKSGVLLATEHGILYPTFFMRTVATKGIGGLISSEFSIPQMVGIYNRIIVSHSPFNNAIISAHGGITFSVNSETMDPGSSIDLPIIYPRLAVFYNQPAFDAGVDFRGKFTPVFGWLLSVENFILSGTAYNWFLENKGVLAYTSKKEKLRIEAGYKLFYGRYPSGPQWHLLPDINLTFGIGK